MAGIPAFGAKRVVARALSTWATSQVDLRIDESDCLWLILSGIHLGVELQVALQSLTTPVANLEVLPLLQAGLADGAVEQLTALLCVDIAGPVLRAGMAHC